MLTPAQFKGNQDNGTLRRFTTLDFEVYYADTTVMDYAPPAIWKVDGLVFMNAAHFWVVAQDSSGIQRVVMVYTQDGMNWQSADLINTSQDHWETTLPAAKGQFIYFVQVVDGAGNVTVTANKGLFFEPARHDVYLPVVMR